MLLTRGLTAAVLLAGFLAALFLLERDQFAIVVAVIVTAGAFEWARLCKAGLAWAWIYALVCGWIYWNLVGVPAIEWIAIGAGVFWLLVAPYWLARGFRPSPLRIRPAVGYIVLIPAALAMAALPPKQLLMMLGLIWIADTGAYLTGRSLGRRKLAPNISPGKTWEGVAGGAVCVAVYAIIWAQFDPNLQAKIQGIFWVPYLAGVVLLFGLSIVGDLFESALKRDAGAKDSGRLLPGHGGVLDRIDSATATLPVALLLMRAVGTA